MSNIISSFLYLIAILTRYDPVGIIAMILLSIVMFDLSTVNGLNGHFLKNSGNLDLKKKLESFIIKLVALIDFESLTFIMSHHSTAGLLKISRNFPFESCLNRLTRTLKIKIDIESTTKIKFFYHN